MISIKTNSCWEIYDKAFLYKKKKKMHVKWQKKKQKNPDNS